MPFLQLRYSLRSLARDPVFTTVVILVLSLGIAANTAIFTVVDQVVLNPLPYRDPARLAMIWESNPSLGEPAGSRVPAAWSNFAEWRNQSHVFEAIEAFERAGYNLTGLGAPEHLIAARATGGYFQMLGARAAQGRTLLPDDARPGAGAVAVVTHAFAKSHFARGDAVGQKLLLDGAPYAIVGVLPRDFHLPVFFRGSFEYKPDIWVPMSPPSSDDASKFRRLFVSGRLKAHMSIAQARAELTIVAKRLAHSDPSLNAGYSINLVPLEIENADPDLDRALYIVWAAALIVLLLGCANLASLMLVRAMNRQKNLAIMGALGAPRAALTGTTFTDSVVLAAVAAALAVLGAYAGVGAIRALQPGDIMGSERLNLDARGLVFAGLAFMTCVLLFGFLPAWLGARRSVLTALNDSSARSSPRSGSAARRILVAVQVAIALVLAIGAMLLVRSFQQILAVDPGFRAHNVLTARIALTPPRYKSENDRRRFCQRFLDGVQQLPGVQSASLVDNFPLYAIRYTPFEIEGRPFSPANPPTADYANVTSDFFQTMGTPLRKGRLFTADDMRDDTDKVAILNESLAHQFWPNQDPVGSHIRLIGPHQDPGPWSLVVGVVSDFRQFNIDTPARPELFSPSRQFLEMTLAMRTTANPANVLPMLQQSIAQIDKEEPLSDVQTLQQMVNHSISQRRFNMLLLSGFAGLSILLALVGVYGLISYTISSRTRDIGIQLTLGAQRRHILTSLVFQILPFVVTGIVLGLLFSLLAQKLVAGLLFGITSLDPRTYLSLPIVLLALAVAICVFPTWRAARLEPVSVLRQE